MVYKFDENGNLIPPGQGDPGQGLTFEELTPEAKVVAANALQASLEKESGSRAELESTLSTQGEELAQANAALDGYRRGERLPKNLDAGSGSNSDREYPDVIEKPNEFAQALKKDILDGVGQMVAGMKATEKVRNEFFQAYPKLRKVEQLVEITTGQYLREHAEDQTLSTPKGKKKAFEEIAKRVIEIIGDIPDKDNTSPPHFEEGGGTGGGARKGRPPNPEKLPTIEEAEKEGLDDYVGSVRKHRATR